MGFLAALLTLLVHTWGLKRNLWASVGYTEDSPGRQNVLTLMAPLLLLGGSVGFSGYKTEEIHEMMEWLVLGNSEINGMTFALAISAWGGLYTFVVRFMKTRTGLLS